MSPLRIVTLLGSVRPGNFTGQALALVEDELSRADDATVERLDPAALRLPLPGQVLAQPSTEAAQAAVAAADGVVLATPEYHGSYSSVMKLLIDNLGFPSVLQGKPVALLGVAAGRLGAVKALEHLRSVASHVGALVLPGGVSVAGVQSVFVDGRCTDPEIERRVRSVASGLLGFVRVHACPERAVEAAARAEGGAA